MKTLTRLLTAAALASLFALPSLAQDAAAAANPCESQERTDLYTKYFNEKKNTNNQEPAFRTAKDYLAKYETACPDQYTKAVRKFHDAYEAASGAAAAQTAWAAAITAKDARRAFETGRALLAKDPENVTVYLLNAATGYNAVITKGSPLLNDPAITAETVAAANKLIELIQAGKEPKDAAGRVSWGEFKSRDEALAWANYWAGSLQFKTNPEAAVKHMVAVAQSNSTVKQEATVYTVLAVGLEAERAAQAQKYTATCKELTPECEVMLANLNQVVDRQIDAYARAVAFVKPDDPRRAEWMTILTELYKSRNNGATDGLQAKIDAVRTTPLLVTTPVTTPPPPPPAPTPTPTPNGQPTPERRP